MPPEEVNMYTLYQQIGTLQGQVMDMKENYKTLTTQNYYLEKKISASIDKVTVGMDTRILALENDAAKSRIKYARLKWSMSMVGVGTTFLGALAAQWIQHLK